MKITPQDIIDKEFRVKFRGFDMAEVDTFLEEVAENFFKLAEENTLLNEKILALQNEEGGAGIAQPMGPAEIPAELTGTLEDLKQDIEAMRSELVGLKQERPDIGSLEKNLQAAIDTLIKTVDERQPQGQLELPADLGKTLEEFKQGTDAIAAELKDFKEEIGSIQKIRDDIKSELKDMLTSHFRELETKLADVRPAAEPAAPKPKAAAKPKKKEALPVAEIAEEPEKTEEDSSLPGYLDDDEPDTEDLEFLSEDDILNVDKLRDVFQSVLDDTVSNGHNTREGEEKDSSADLLFFEDDDLLIDDHEPEVTFSLDNKETEKKPKTQNP